jgi:large subunit ribosomal protein L25
VKLEYYNLAVQIWVIFVQEMQLDSEPRERVGTIASRVIRSGNKIPAIAYAQGMETICIAVPEKPVSLLYETGRIFNTKITLLTEGKKLESIIREIALHPVKDSITHIDFHVLTGKDCKVKVPVRFLGSDVCPGIKKGGLLNKIQRFLWISCNSDNIPQSIDFDVSQLEGGQTVCFADAILPSECSIIPSKRGNVVASILSKR